MKKINRGLLGVVGFLALMGISGLAWAADAAVPVINTGDTAWVLLSAALVFLMTPGLAFFYGGLSVRRTCFRCSCSVLC